MQSSNNVFTKIAFSNYYEVFNQKTFSFIY